MNPSKLKPMLVIHTVFCTAIAGFAVVAILMNKDRMHFTYVIDKTDPYYPLFPILAAIFVIVGFFMFNKQIRAIVTPGTGDEKIAGYQTAFIMRCAFLQAAGLLNVIAFLLSANALYLLVVAGVLIVFLLTRPSKQHIIDTTDLQYPDTEKL